MLNRKIIQRFSDTFQAHGFKASAFAPSYGLAEATLMVSARFGLKWLTLNKSALQRHQVSIEPESPSTVDIVSCGIPYQTVKIVHLQDKIPCKENEIGEIWVSSDSVALGYWHKPKLTQETFQAQLPEDPNTNYLKTGDLGFLYEGELYITGRLKDLIIINGLNFYPNDLELAVQESDPILKEESCVAFAYRSETQATDSVVILIKQPRQLTTEQAKSCEIAIRKRILKEFQIIPHDIQFVNFSFPKTTSGKLQRHQCLALYQERVLIKECPL